MALLRPHASATVQRVFAITGRGVALELSALAGTIRRGDWLSGFPAPHDRRCVQLLGVEFVDRGFVPGPPESAIAVVVARLKPELMEALPGTQLFFSRHNPWTDPSSGPMSEPGHRL